MSKEASFILIIDIVLLHKRKFTQDLQDFILFKMAVLGGPNHMKLLYSQSSKGRKEEEGKESREESLPHIFTHVLLRTDREYFGIHAA